MRDKKLKELRPHLDLPTTYDTEMEAFQSNSLRPILKLQQESTASLLAHSSHFKKLEEKIDANDTKAYDEVVQKYVSSNIVFRSRLVGMILGVMTASELEFYYANTPEVSKRIVSMQIKRFVDTQAAVL